MTRRFLSSLSQTPRFVPMGALLIALALIAGGCASEGERLYKQGKAFYKKGSYVDAIKTWDKAAAAFQKEGGHPGRAWEKIGTALKELKRPAEAAVYFEKAIVNDPLELETHRKLIRAWTEARDFAKARAAADRLKTDPKLAQELRFRPEKAREIQEAIDQIAEAEQAAVAKLAPQAPASQPESLDALAQSSP
jgi:tetratricopeptide (TPR) repeat protein